MPPSVRKLRKDAGGLVSNWTRRATRVAKAGSA